MKNRILAVCDPDASFASRFMEYLNTREYNPFYIQAFTSLRELSGYERLSDIELILTTEQEVEKNPDDRWLDKLVLLSDGRVGPEFEGVPTVYKYQSADSIIREVMNCYAENGSTHLDAALFRQNAQIIGIYSPIHGIGKTTFALTLGSQLAKKGKTLYLNLEGYSGLAERFGRNCSRTLSDLLYFLQDEKQGFLYKLGSCVINLQDMDFVMPSPSPEDLLCVTSDEWELLLEKLITDAGYTYVIIDFSDSIQGLPTLLKKCSRIYMPVSRDTSSDAKLKQCQNHLRLRGLDIEQGAACLVRLPARSGDPGAFSSGISACVKELLMHERTPI